MATLSCPTLCCFSPIPRPHLIRRTPPSPLGTILHPSCFVFSTRFPLLLPVFPATLLQDSLRSLLSVALAFSFIFFPTYPSIAVSMFRSEHNCDDLAHFYEGVDGLKGAKLRNKLFKLIRKHHVVPYEKGISDWWKKKMGYHDRKTFCRKLWNNLTIQVWDALNVLDAADPYNPEATLDIIEIYSQKAVSKALAGKGDGWNREHLWPRSYGIKRGRPEFSDLHNLRPSDMNVNSARGRKYYGECRQTSSKICTVPANPEAAYDTATDKNIWMPPSRVRGDIARSLMYMAVRYGTSEVHLQLSDSPNAGRHRMGLLSVLLHWNAIDPPSSEEKIRNSRICTMYQHNRNPFVDHPEFADLIWKANSAFGGMPLEWNNHNLPIVH